jgi:butyryl-CoA dehydrogenase
MEQKRLQADARAFARDVLTKVGPATRGWPTPLARFAATRPFYEQAVAAGFLRRLIPAPLGGEGTGGLDMAVLAEEFHAVDANVSLTLLGTMLGLFPVLLAGNPEQQARFAAPFVTGQGAPLASFCFSEPGGSANFAAPRPAEGVRTVARRANGDDASDWIITGAKKWASSATGWDGRGADLMTVVCRTDPNAPPERRGGAVPIIEYQAVGYALADAKTAIEAVRTLSWRAAHAVDAHTPGALELALHAKVFGSETAVRIITDLMRVVGVDSYDHDMPLGGLLVDALVLPLFDGGNMGVRRRQLHDLMRAPGYDPLAAAG